MVLKVGHVSFTVSAGETKLEGYEFTAPAGLKRTIKALLIDAVDSSGNRLNDVRVKIKFLEQEHVDVRVGNLVAYQAVLQPNWEVVSGRPMVIGATNPTASTATVLVTVIYEEESA